MSKINSNSNQWDSIYLNPISASLLKQEEAKSEQVLPESGQDEFHSHTKSEEAKTNHEAHHCTFIDPYLKMILEILSPVLSFISSITGIDTGLTKEETIKAFNKLVLDTEAKINSTQMSEKTKETLARVYSSVKEIESRKDLSNLDLKELISHWKETKSHKALLLMSEKIKNGECVKISNNRMKKVFSDGLESFADSLDEALGHPPSEKRDLLIQKLHKGADKHVDAIEVVAKKGDDKNLTVEDKEIIKNKLQESAEVVQEIKRDPELVKYIKNTCEKLFSWSSYVIEKIEEMIKEWKIADEKKKIKQAAEKKYFNKKIDKQIKIAKNRAKKAEHFHALMNKVRFQLQYGKLKPSAISEKFKEVGFYTKAYNKELGRELYHERKKDNLISELYMNELFMDTYNSWDI